MGVTYTVFPLNNGFQMETTYFLEQLKEKWSEVETHLITDRVEPILQWSLTTDYLSMLGDFTGGGISYESNSLENIAKVALWFRSIVPSKERLLLLDSGLNNAAVELTENSIEADILESFNKPFDPDELELLSIS
jgi:hypothetical protein